MASRMEQRRERRGRKNLAAREAASWAAWMLCAVALAVVIRLFVFTLAVVDGSSMETTLFNGEVIGVSVAHYRFSQPQRGDVAICHYPGDEDYFVKRVIGLPGEWIEIRDQSVYINGDRILEPYLHEETLRDFGPAQVPEDSYFVMGDNRNYSSDSRNVGPIAGDQMVGRALWVIWPLNSMRGIAGSEMMEQSAKE